MDSCNNADRIMNIDRDGFIYFVLAMYALTCNDLVLAYKKQFKAKSEYARIQAADEAIRLEEWLQNDPYCILSDPDKIIREAKDRAKRGGQFHFEFHKRKTEELQT